MNYGFYYHHQAEFALFIRTTCNEVVGCRTRVNHSYRQTKGKRRVDDSGVFIMIGLSMLARDQHKATTAQQRAAYLLVDAVLGFKHPARRVSFSVVCTVGLRVNL